jgi:hypothetical protein
MASASRDFAPQHHNTWYCHHKSRVREMFLGTHFNLGMLSRFMTDYGGPRSTVRRIQLQMMRTIGAGEDYRMTGVITRKWEKDGEKRVDMDIAIDTQLGPGYRFVCLGRARPEARGRRAQVPAVFVQGVRATGSGRLHIPRGTLSPPATLSDAARRPTHTGRAFVAALGGGWVEVKRSLQARPSLEPGPCEAEGRERRSPAAAKEPRSEPWSPAPTEGRATS